MRKHASGRGHAGGVIRVNLPCNLTVPFSEILSQITQFHFEKSMKRQFSLTPIMRIFRGKYFHLTIEVLTIFKSYRIYY